jgi:hypothetical protein
MGVFYAQHTHGVWLSKSDIKFFPETCHPIVYVAWSTHASYSQAGIFTLLKKDKKTGVILDPSVTLLGVKIGGADVTANGICWDTWKDAALEIVEIDGLTMKGDVPPSPDWLSFKGMWGGPYPVNYGVLETAKILAGFIKAVALANPWVSVGVILIVVGVLIGVLSGLGIVALIRILIGLGIAGFLIGMIVLWNTEFKSTTSMGPTAPITKGYWLYGESVTFNTGVTQLKSKKDYVKIKFSPGRTILGSVHYVLYSDRDNKFWYQTSTDTITWGNQIQIAKTEIHCSPEPVIYQHDKQNWLYVFSQDSKAVIQYNFSKDGLIWSRNSLSLKMILNANLSATILDKIIYLVFRNIDKTMHMMAGAIDIDGGVSWIDVTVPSSIGALDTDPCITSFQNSLYVTYKQGASSYLIQSYGVLSVEDKRPMGELKWSDPSIFTNNELPTLNTPQPVAVNDRLFLIFDNSTTNAAYNIYANGILPESEKYQYKLGSAFWLGMALKTYNKIGMVSGPDAPLYLAVRQSKDDKYLYLTAAYF